MKLSINEGQKFGMLTVLKESEALKLPSGQKNRAFLCVCECGAETIVRLLHLTRGRIKSCGCLQGEKHLPDDKHLWNVYRGMRNRCYGENTAHPHLYKDKGIRVCADWNASFYTFKKWAHSNGYAKHLQIDRIDNSAGYRPDNCRWVTPLENCNNRGCTIRVVYKGKLSSLSMILHEKKLVTHHATIRQRIERGWSADDAIDTPIRKGNYKRRYSLKE